MVHAQGDDGQRPLRPRFEPEQEVRFAVVMYGGVSLAIYINGVAQELFRLVRATAPSRRVASVPHEVWFATVAEPGQPQLSAAERVYRELGQLLPLREGTPGASDADAPVRTRFVVDILSGSSAGGLNAIFLAKAIANQQDFDGLRDLWIKEADIEVLLGDELSWQGVDMASRPEPPPQSLLNGYRLYAKALATLRGMAGTEQAPRDDFAPSYAEELDLSVTTTDLDGLPETLKLATGTATERRHRHVLRFSYSAEEATGEEHSDFGPESDAMLALAARCTSSFPMAFEPMIPEDIDRVERGALRADWRRWFPEHVQAGAEWRRSAFADGGYLDNKPFTYATDTLRRRRADLPVQRKLVYIEPHPAFTPGAGAGAGDAPVRHSAGPRPDVYRNVAAALVALPRYETIREDVTAVAERNRVIGRLRELTSGLERSIIGARGPSPAGAEVVDAAAADDANGGALDRASPSYRVYSKLRAQVTLDELIGFVSTLRSSAGRAAVEAGERAAMAHWVAETCETGPDAFLISCDAAYRRRRLSFLQDRVGDLLAGGARSSRMMGVARDRATAAQGAGGLAGATAAGGTGAGELSRDMREELARAAPELRALKLALNGACALLRQVQRAPHARNLDNVLSPGSGHRQRYDAFAAAAIDDADVAALMGAFADFLGPPLALTDQAMSDCLARTSIPAWMRELLQAYDDRMETFDSVTLPLTYPDLGETNPVEILRVSPQDATSLFPRGADGARRDPSAKLGGVAVGHFGAFLDAGWRRNDLLWGRLDGAECIVNALVPEQLRDGFRTRIQAGILREELTGAGRAQVQAELGRVAFASAGDEQLVDAFRAAYPGPGELDAARMRVAGRRAWRIGFQALAAGADGRGKPGWPLRVIARADLLARLAGRRVFKPSTPRNRRARRRA